MVLKIFKGRVDGSTIHLDEPVNLPKDTPVEVRVEEVAAAAQGTAPLAQASRDCWDVLMNLAGTLEMPEDWAEEHDHYIHGTPKKNEPMAKSAS